MAHNYIHYTTTTIHVLLYSSSVLLGRLAVPCSRCLLQVWWSTFPATLYQHYGIFCLPLGQPTGKYLLSKISKGGQGQHSVYLAS
jgi:hypothetical protein